MHQYSRLDYVLYIYIYIHSRFHCPVSDTVYFRHNLLKLSSLQLSYSRHRYVTIHKWLNQFMVRPSTVFHRIDRGTVKFGTGVLHLIQISHQPDATFCQFSILTFVYSLAGFGRFPAHHQELNDCSGSLWFYLRIVVIAVLYSWSGRPA